MPIDEIHRSHADVYVYSTLSTALVLLDLIQNWQS